VIIAIPAIGPTTTPAIQALLVDARTGSVVMPVSFGDAVALAVAMEAVAILDESGMEEVAPVSVIR
jgi:hypothetical protein